MMIDGLNKRSHNDLDTYKFSKEYNEKEQEKRRVQKLAIGLVWIEGFDILHM